MAEVLKKSFRCFEIVTQMAYLDRLEIQGEEPVKGLDALRLLLQSWEQVEQVVGGVHTLDYKEKVGGDLVEPHIHYYVKLKDASKLSTILSKINNRQVNDKNYIPPSLTDAASVVVGYPQIEAIKSSFSECLDYLLHRDKKSLEDPLKHQYTEDEVGLWVYGASVEQIEADTQRVNRGSPFVRVDKDADFWSLYGERITHGELTRSKLMKSVDLVPHLDYIKYSAQFNKIFERMETIELAKMQEEGAEMEVMYVTGAAGTGKTTWAKKWAEKQGLDYFVSGSSNDPFDGYLGEPVVILDDLRGSAFAFADLLKLLDNNTRSKVKSRFYNKLVQARYIIITSIMPIEQLYSMFDKDDANKEPLEQLKRRCRTYIVFTADHITLRNWNAEKQLYEFVADLPNTVALEYKAKQQMTDADRVAMVTNLFEGIGKGATDMAKYVKTHPIEAIDSSNGWNKPTDKEAEQLLDLFGDGKGGKG